MKVGDLVKKHKGYGSNTLKGFVGVVIEIQEEKVVILTEDGYETWIKSFVKVISE